ncbi:unnamed protein product [Calicophoron daubneyi]|uniref:Uncharacterized protein n=1 Tax=Calicophoron daubneyi TaxID=300641 RepID=A0AAV2TVI0_CALDB
MKSQTEGDDAQRPLPIKRFFVPRIFVYSNGKKTATRVQNHNSKPSKDGFENKTTEQKNTPKFQNVVTYRIEVQPPMLHLKDPSELVIKVIGDRGHWTGTAEFCYHSRIRQSSYALVHQKPVGKIRLMKMTLREEQKPTYYKPDKVWITRYLSAEEICGILRKQQFYHLVPSSWRNSEGQVRRVELMRKCQASLEGVQPTVLPLAEKYMFQVDEPNGLKGDGIGMQTILLFELMFSRVYLRLKPC